jgi:hypothetical protein
MNILFKSTQLLSFHDTITKYNNASYQQEKIGNDIKFKFLPVTTETYEAIRGMQNDNIEIEGFPAYLLMTKAAYETLDVPVGVSFSEELDNEGVPTGNQKKWFEWQPQVTLERNDEIEVIIPTTYQSVSATRTDFILFEVSAVVVDVFGADELGYKWSNDGAWIQETPIDKTASYYTEFWESEAFDFLHAQRLVRQWFDGLVGITDTDKFISLDYLEQIETVRWGVLADDAEGKGLVESVLPDPRYRASFNMWNKRRLITSHTIRFESAFTFLLDNFKIAAIENKMDAMLTAPMKEYYIRYGASTNATHLIVNNEINTAFWATFVAGDVGYSDQSLNTIKFEVEKILDGDKYEFPVIS